MIIAATFKAFYTDNLRLLPEEVHITAICNAIGISYTELMKQPAWWVDAYQHYLEGKGKADKERLKVKQPKPQRIANRIR